MTVMDAVNRESSDKISAYGAVRITRMFSAFRRFRTEQRAA